ncbi:MAG: type II and III secretion system protein [Fibrobacter sp.]|nr:type II and III secretion system protein [Fibrobacter sp.]
MKKFLFFILFSWAGFCSWAWSADYEFNGFYYLVDIYKTICKNCQLDLPPEYLHQEIFLNVSTNSKTEFDKRLIQSSKGLGWSLKVGKNYYSASKIQNDENIVFVSCLDLSVKNVPKYSYSAEKKADSIRCVIRDSLKVDSLRVVDSLAQIKDSLALIPPLPFRDYELKYFNFNKAFADKMGVKWGELLWAGDLKNIDFFHNWTASAIETNDTSFSFRAVSFALDSSIVLNWGTEEQVQKQSFNDNGVVTTDYEWRNYGLEVQIESSAERIKMSYTFREKDANTTILSGSVVGSPNDTLVLSGDYILKRDISKGVPLLAKIPIIRVFFSSLEVVSEFRKFYIYLIPKEVKK